MPISENNGGRPQAGLDNASKPRSAAPIALGIVLAAVVLVAVVGGAYRLSARETAPARGADSVELRVTRDYGATTLVGSRGSRVVGFVDRPAVALGERGGRDRLRRRLRRLHRWSRVRAGGRRVRSRRLVLLRQRACRPRSAPPTTASSPTTASGGTSTLGSSLRRCRRSSGSIPSRSVPARLPNRCRPRSRTPGLRRGCRPPGGVASLSGRRAGPRLRV